MAESGLRKVLRAVAAGLWFPVRLAVDLVLLTRDTVRILVWLLASLPGYMVFFRPPTGSPFGCHAKGRACPPAGKYRSPLVFRALCGSVRKPTDAGVQPACGQGKSQYRLQWWRVGATGLALLGIWAAAGLSAAIAVNTIWRVATPTQPGGTPASKSTEADAGGAAEYLESARKHFVAKRYREAAIEYRNAAKHDPSNAQTHYGLGECRLQGGLIEAARKAFEEALRLAPTMAQAHRRLAELWVARRDAARALVHAQELRGLGAEDPEAHILLARAYVLRGDLAAARKEAEAAVARDGKNANAQVLLGELYLLEKDYVAAERGFRTALDMDVEHEEGRLGLANALARQERFGPAIEQFRALLERNPGQVTAAIGLADLYVARGNPDLAATELRRLVKRRPEAYAARARLAELLVRSGRANEGYQVATELLRDHPGDNNAHLVLADMFHGKGLYILAAEHCEKALLSSSCDLRAHRLLAHARFNGRDYEAAVAPLQRVLEQTPEDQRLHLMLGAAQAALGRVAQAKACFEQAATLFKESPLSPVRLVQPQEEQGETAAAIASYREALRRAPDEPLGANNLARLLLAHGGDVEEAQQRASKVREAQPDNASVADILGLSLVRPGERTKALEHFPFAAQRPASTAEVRHDDGVALDQTDDTKGALRKLRAAPASREDLASAKEAQAVLDELGKKGAEGGRPDSGTPRPNEIRKPKPKATPRRPRKRSGGWTVPH